MRDEWMEDERLAALKAYRVLDTPPEPAFDDLVQLAVRICAAPVGLIAFVADRRQWFKAETGLGFRETPLDCSCGAGAMLQPGLTVVRDVARDPRFSRNPLVTGAPHLRFYAGAVLETPDGLPLGTLCILDVAPRDLSDDQAFTLTTLARQAMSQLELRRALAERDEALKASHRVEERQSLLVRELHHRVRNSLAVVQALVRSSARTSHSVEEFHRAFSARIGSLAKTQTLLTEDDWQTASLRELIAAELRPFGPDPQPRFSLAGPPVLLAADLAVPVGMALHELAANAARYGALSSPQGHVAITWDIRKADGRMLLHLEWVEAGGPPVKPPRREGFGTTLLTKILPLQCDAKVAVSYPETGVRCCIEAPMIERRPLPHH